MFDHQPQGKSAAAGRKPGTAQQHRWSDDQRKFSVYKFHLTNVDRSIDEEEGEGRRMRRRGKEGEEEEERRGRRRSAIFAAILGLVKF